jgi:ribosome-associated translation inhibitor RaiA
MEIIFHGHHANISQRMRRRAEIAAERSALKLKRAVDAIIRFEQDGPMKRVEIVLHAPMHKSLVACGEAKFYGPALTTAVTKLDAQVRKLKSVSKALKHKSVPRK